MCVCSCLKLAADTVVGLQLVMVETQEASLLLVIALLAPC